MIIAITGTPGTGKTTLGKALATELGFTYIDLNALIEEKSWHEGKDEERDSLIVDEEKLSERVESVLEDGQDYVIDSHLSHFLDEKLVDLCIICTCELSVLKERLEKRGYAEKKVRENLDAEIFEVCRVEAEERNHKILIVDSKISPQEVVTQVSDLFGGKT